MNYYSNSIEANNFFWEFQPNSNILNSTLENPTNYFLSTGSTQVKLIAWSNNGCYDSITKTGTYIFTPTTPIDSCWVNHDISGSSLLSEVYHTKKGRTGYFSSGILAPNKAFGTQQGDTIISSISGGYLIKSDNNGVSKWMVYSDSYITSSDEDSQGFLYITIQRGATYFIDNSNDTVLFNISSEGAIIKLDSLGVTQWYRSGFNFNPHKVAIDKSDSVYVLFRHFNYFSGTPTLLSFNGNTTDSLGVDYPNLGFGLLKLGPGGDYIWEITFEDFGSPYSFPNEALEFDAFNNIYLNKSFKTIINIHQPSGNTYTLTQPMNETYSKPYVVKFNSEGELIWLTYSKKEDNLPYHITSFDFYLDADGNSYMTGRNRDHLICIDATGDTTRFDKGQFYVQKLNVNGGCEWIVGSSTRNGQGESITMYNNELFVILTPYYYPPTSSIQTIYFVNEDSTGIELNLETLGHYYIAVYDTLGNVLRILTSSNNSAPANIANFANFESIDNGTFLLSKTLNNYIPGIYCDFGTCINNTSGLDATTIKFSEQCAIINNNLAYIITIDTVVCENSIYTLPDGTNIVVNVSITDTSRVLLASGQDSIIITNITYEIIQNSSQQIQVCTGTPVIFPDNSVQIVNTPFTHTSILSSNYGCDSIVYSIVSIVSAYSIVQNLIVCEGSTYTFPDSTSQTITSPTQHISTLLSSTGCDSVIQTNLAITTLNTSISIFDSTIVSLSLVSGLQYQWLDCTNSNIQITGATDQSFSPSNYGSYSLELTSGLCIDTSNCIIYELVFIENLIPDTFKVFPNPFVRDITFDFSGESITIELFSIEGALIHRVIGILPQTKVNLEKLQSGTYFLKIRSNENSTGILKIIKL